MTYYTVTLYANFDFRVVDTYLFETCTEARSKKDKLFKSWRETFPSDERQVFDAPDYTLVKEGDETMLEIKIEAHDV